MYVFIIIVAFSYLFLNLYNVFFTKIFIFSLLLFFTVYWLYIIFIFLKKVLYVSKSTSNVYRFWKQSYYLFWGLEFGLFIIYLYLFLNTTSEIWPMNIVNYATLCAYDNSVILSTLLVWYAIFFMLNSVVPVLIYNTYSFVILFLLLLCSLYFLYLEGFAFIYLNNFFNLYIYVFEYSDKSWNFEPDLLITQPIYYYFYIFTLLKLWHLFFIIYFLVIQYNFIHYSCNKGYLNQTACSFFFIKQNFYFLFMFYLFTLLIIFKPLFLALFTSTYGELYLHVNMYGATFINIISHFNYIIF